MTNPITWAKKEISRLSPRWRGLGLATIGFMGAVVGALLSAGSAYLFSAVGLSDSLAKYAVVGLWWTVVVFGMLVMASGITWHWCSMFSDGNGKE